MNLSRRRAADWNECSAPPRPGENIVAHPSAQRHKGSRLAPNFLPHAVNALKEGRSCRGRRRTGERRSRPIMPIHDDVVAQVILYVYLGVACVRVCVRPSFRRPLSSAASGVSYIIYNIVHAREHGLNHCKGARRCRGSSWELSGFVTTLAAWLATPDRQGCIFPARTSSRAKRPHWNQL